jgi:O-acetyl-ADP-ribose deacetylase (regulator of RNase III)
MSFMRRKLAAAVRGSRSFLFFLLRKENRMKITLFDTNAELCAAWEREFGNCPDISVKHCALEDLPYHDFLVTPGNSFGAMSGGFDLAVRDMLGYQFQDFLQLEIMKSTTWGIPVGNIMFLNLDPPERFTSIIYAPTMRTPSPARSLDITYVMSILTSVAFDNPDKTLAIPGLGTGCGKLSPSDAAKAMRAGYDAGVYVRRA